MPVVNTEGIRQKESEPNWLERAADGLVDVFYVYDLQQRANVYCNRSIWSSLGYTPEDIAEMGDQFLATLVHPDDLPRIEENRARLINAADGEIVVTEYRIRDIFGDYVWLRSRDNVIERDARGIPQKIVGIASDITPEKLREIHLQNQMSVLEDAIEGVAWLDNEGHVLRGNYAIADLFQTEENELFGRSIFDFLGAEAHPDVWTALHDRKPFARDFEASWMSGEELKGYLHVRMVRLEKGGPIADGLLLYTRDITAQRSSLEAVTSYVQELSEAQVQLELNRQELELANAELRRLAEIDGLTGLLNHRTFQERLSEMIAEEKRVALILLDVDKFKEFNDTYGHPGGDEVLRGVGQVLTEITKELGTAARYGGEEFAVIFPYAESNEVHAMAERVRAGIEAREWPHRQVTVSVGASLLGSDRDRKALIEQADLALYSSKKGGRNRVTVFSPAVAA